MAKQRGKYWDERRIASLMALRKAYDLRVMELTYLKAAIREETAEIELPEAVKTKLDSLAADVRLFFEHGCVESKQDLAYAAWRDVLRDEARQRRHTELWEQIREAHRRAFLERAEQNKGPQRTAPKPSPAAGTLIY